MDGTWEADGPLVLTPREEGAVLAIAESMRRAVVRRLPPGIELVALDLELQRRAVDAAGGTESAAGHEDGS